MFDGFQNAVNSLYQTGDFMDESYFEDRVCPRCKTRESDVKETGVLGCANCFKVFRDTISRAAYRIHGRLEHLGKVPQKTVSKAEKEREIAELQKLMRECAEREDYDQANAYKRKIESLKGEM